MNSTFSSKQWRKALIWSSLLLQSVFATAQTTLISPTGDGGFENSSSLLVNGWTTVNAFPDAWTVGSAAVQASGARGAFISNDNGGTWAYSLNAAITHSHLYKEVTIPAGENKITLTFKWKAGGEGVGAVDNDNLKVFFGPTANVSPSTTAGLNTLYQLIGPTSVSGMYKFNSTGYNTETITFSASPGTYKLVFSWKSNTTVLSNPPAAIDDISLVSGATSTITSTVMGGFWNSPQTWVGGVVPAGDDAVIAPNSTVIVDAPVMVRDLTIAGQLQSAPNLPRMVIGRDVLIQNTGIWNAFGAMVTPGNPVSSIPVYIGGNFTNNGFATFAAAGGILAFNGSMQNSRMAQTLDGTGSFLGTGSSGILRTLFIQTTGSVTVATTQNLIISGTLSQGAGTLHTNGKLTLDNTAQVFGQPYNQQVCMIAVTNMGAGYTSQPTVTLSAPTSAGGVTATAVANYDAPTGSIRSITVTNAGSGYGIAPTVTITGGGTPVMEATASATVNNLISGNTSIAGQKSGGTTVTGGLNFAAVPQSLGSIFVANSATTNIGYTSVPEIGFNLPGGMLNYVTNGGSGYTSAPTVTVVGGTKVAGGADPVNFNVQVCQGKIVSITLSTTGGGSSGWTTLPTISITGGGGSGATAEFPAGCLATATPVLSNGMISNFIITNPGFGYGGTPAAILAGGTPTAAAGVPVCRSHVYTLTVGYYLPSTAPAVSVEDAFIPSHRKISALTISNYSGVQLNGDLELYATSAPLTFSGGGGVLKMGSTGTNTLSFPYSVYTGTSSALGYVLGSVKLASNGGTGNKTFPFNTPFVVNTGSGSLATGNTITSITATKMPNPSGATNNSGITTGAFGYRVVTNAGAVFGTNPYVTMNYNTDDAIACTDNAQLFIAQATANTGGTRTIRSVAAAAATFTATGARTTDITGTPGSIVPTNDDYYSWATTVTPNVSAATGNWNAPATWSLGRVPDCTDWAIVQAGHTVTVNSAGNSTKLTTINQGGTLSVVTGGTLSVGCTGYNNPLNIRGTLDVQGGTLNVNGNIDASASSIFNQSGGNINVDGNDAGAVATSVASGISLIQLRPSTFNSVNWTGGTLTIVDPHAATTLTQVLNVLGTSFAGVNVTTGHTLRFGNGVSTDAGGNVNGFSSNTWANFTVLPLGNVIVESPAGTNRIATSVYQQLIRGNLTINNGGEYSVTSTFLTGNLTVNTGGTYTSNGYLSMTDAPLSPNGGYTLAPTMTAQSITNQGVMRNTAVSPVVQLIGLYVNNNSATGVTFNSPLTVGYLSLASGKVTTTTTNLLTLGYTGISEEGNLIGGSSTAYIDGPMGRVFSTRSANPLYYDVMSLFPIGKGSTYMPVYMTPTTVAPGLQVKAEAFTSNTGTYNSPLTSLASKRWEVSVLANSGYMTETGIRLNDAGITAGKELAQASSGAGAYGAITNASTYSAGALTTATPILSANFTGFLSYGDRCATAAPAATATQAQCSGKTVANLTATPAAGGTLSWYNVAVGGSALASNTVLATGTYYVAQTIGGCESNRTAVAVTVNAAPTAIITGSNTICQGQSGTLSANTGAGLTYQWQNNGVNIASATNATYSATAAGAYTVIVTNANTCSATSAATNVTILSKPTVSFTNSLQAGTGSVVNFTNTSSAGTVIWYFGDALNTTSTQSNPTFWYKANGTFSAKLVVTGANGCSDSTAVSIAITGVRTGVKDLAEALKIKVYPNPFSEVVQIEIENTTVSWSNEDKIMVTNALGQVVYQGVLNQKSISLETQTWSEGIYNIVLLSKGQTIPVKNVVKVAR